MTYHSLISVKCAEFADTLTDSVRQTILREFIRNYEAALRTTKAADILTTHRSLITCYESYSGKKFETNAEEYINHLKRREKTNV